MERWDAYDADFHRVEGKSLVRGEPIPDGLYHIVCDVLVRHTDGSYLLMLRDPRKHSGGMWEASAGGSALQGEAPMACAVRELREETGLCGRMTEVGRTASARNPHAVRLLPLRNGRRQGRRHTAGRRDRGLPLGQPRRARQYAEKRTGYAPDSEFHRRAAPPGRRSKRSKRLRHTKRFQRAGSRRKRKNRHDNRKDSWRFLCFHQQPRMLRSLAAGRQRDLF